MQENFSIISAEEKVRRARTWLLLNKPFWGTLLMKLKIGMSTSPDCHTMITDGRSIKFNEAYVNRLSFDECSGVLAHEVGHCALKHVFRAGGRDHKAWEESCDHVVNLALLRDGFELPGAPYADAQFEGMSAEQVYPVVLARRGQEEQEKQEQQQKKQQAQQKKQQPQDPSEEGDSDDEESDSMGEMAAPGSLSEGDEQEKQAQDPSDEAEHESEAEAQEQQKEEESSDEAEGEGEGEGEEEHDSEGSKDVGDADDESASQAMSEADEHALEDEWGQAAAAAAQQALVRGHGSAQQQRSILASNHPPLPFDEYLRLFLMRCVERCDQSWQRQSRRTIASGPYLPSLRGEKLGCIVMVVDTSGSISDSALAKFIKQAGAAKSDLQPREVRVLFADDAVCGEMSFGEFDDLVITEKDCVSGSGGTDFRPAFERVKRIEEEEGIEVAGVIYITDLEGDFPTAAQAEALAYPPTLWVFDSSGHSQVTAKRRAMKAVTFGEVVEII